MGPLISRLKAGAAARQPASAYAAHGVCSRSSSVILGIRRREFQDGRGRGTAESCMVAEIVVYWRPVCSTSRGQPPTWCDLWRCREMITKLHFEGVRRDIPGPTPSTGTSPTTGRGVSPRHPGRRLPPNFYMTGTNPRTGHHWTAFLCPVIRRPDVTVESPHGKSKGGNGGVVSTYLWRCPGETVSCGASQL